MTNSDLLDDDFLQLNRGQCLTLVGAIAYSVVDGVTVKKIYEATNLWVLPSGVIESCDLMTDPELLELMHQITKRLPELPPDEEEEEDDPCPICGEPEVEIETGFCCRCNALLNGAAAAQVLGVSCSND